MRRYLLGFKKVTLVSLMVFLLLAMVSSAFAPPGDTMGANPLTVPVTINGAWGAGEWNDALQYTMSNSIGGNIGYIRAKYNATHLLVIIDSPWDTTPSTIYWHENVWLAFDKANDAGGAPKAGDYLVHPTTSWTTSGWVGNGAGWTATIINGVQVTQAGENFGAVPLGTSPNSGVPHRITEMAVPLAYVGSAYSTLGFYVQVDDDSTDPDGTGPQPATAYSEWPTNSGGSPGWPSGFGSAPCPVPNAWGDLILLRAQVGGTWVLADKLALLAPYIALTLAIIVAIAATAAFFKYRRK